MVRTFKRLAKRFAPHLVYRRPVSHLQPERLYAYLDALWQRRELPGAVVEVGCYRGGTAALAFSMLCRTGYPKRYVCVDTFEGFVPSQFDRDVELGTPESHRELFSDASLSVVRGLLDRYGCAKIELLRSDIACLAEDLLPDSISVCLLDVDLALPTHEALQKIYPRLVRGGLILIDDCPGDTPWVGARKGYESFVSDAGLSPRYFLGMGLIARG